MQGQPPGFQTKDTPSFLHTPKPSRKRWCKHFQEFTPHPPTQPGQKVRGRGGGQAYLEERKSVNNSATFSLSPLCSEHLLSAVMDENSDDEWQTFLLKTTEWEIHQGSRGRSLHKKTKRMLRNSGFTASIPNEIPSPTRLPTVHQCLRTTIKKAFPKHFF